MRIRNRSADTHGTGNRHEKTVVSSGHTEPVQTHLHGMKMVQLLVQGIPKSPSFLIVKGISYCHVDQQSTIGELYSMLKRMEVPYRERKACHDEDTVSRRYN